MRQHAESTIRPENLNQNAPLNRNFGRFHADAKALRIPVLFGTTKVVP
jgi:hypothetical protein